MTATGTPPDGRRVVASVSDQHRRRILRDLLTASRDREIRSVSQGWLTTGEWLVRGCSTRFRALPIPDTYFQNLLSSPRVPLTFLGDVVKENAWALLEPGLDHGEHLALSIYEDANGHISTIDGRFAALLEGLTVVRLEWVMGPSDVHPGYDRESYMAVAGVDDNGEIQVVVMVRSPVP